MPGQDRSKEASASACQTRCQQTEGCGFFSWWGDGGCHLQSSSAVAISAPGVTSGPKSCPAGILLFVCVFSLRPETLSFKKGH